MSSTRLRSGMSGAAPVACRQNDLSRVRIGRHSTLLPVVQVPTPNVTRFYCAARPMTSGPGTHMAIGLSRKHAACHCSATLVTCYLTSPSPAPG